MGVQSTKHADGNAAGVGDLGVCISNELLPGPLETRRTRAGPGARPCEPRQLHSDWTLCRDQEQEHKACSRPKKPVVSGEKQTM